MYGWRARIGIIIPHVNMTLEPEFNMVLPTGVSVHAARMVIPELNEHGLEEMARDSMNAAHQLAEIDADVVLFGCTSGSFLGGARYEREMVSSISKITGCPTITTSGAMVDALKAMNVGNVAVATPYVDAINERLGRYLEEHKITTANLLGLGLDKRTADFPLAKTPVSAIALQSEEVVYRLARGAMTPEAEAVFISCTNLATLGVVEKLEEDLCVPVISANQASIWSALRAAGLDGALASLGQLGTKPATPACNH